LFPTLVPQGETGGRKKNLQEFNKKKVLGTFSRVKKITANYCKGDVVKTQTQTGKRRETQTYKENRKG